MTRRNPQHAITARQVKRLQDRGRFIAAAERKALTDNGVSESFIDSGGARGTVSLVLPIPDVKLNPNTKPRSTAACIAKADAARNARWRSKTACQSLLNLALPLAGNAKLPHWPGPGTTIQYTLYAETNRRRDDDNLIGSCKPYRDGLKDAGLLLDDHGLTTLPPTFEVDADAPRLVVEVTRA